MEPEELLHSIDLRQIERLKKLLVHLQADLHQWEQQVKDEAEWETRFDYIQCGYDTPEDNPNGESNGNAATRILETRKLIETQVENVKLKKVNLAKAMKLAVFNCNNSLKQLHDQRMRIQSTPVPEVLEAIEV